MEERLVLGAGRLYVGRKCGGYRDKPYDGKTHVILPRRERRIFVRRSERN